MCEFVFSRDHAFNSIRIESDLAYDFANLDFVREGDVPDGALPDNPSGRICDYGSNTQRNRLAGLNRSDARDCPPP